MLSVRDVCLKAKEAAFELAAATTEEKNKMLYAIANAINSNKAKIYDANALDIEAARGVIKDSMLDRLTLTEARINTMVDGVMQVASLPDPIGEVTDSWVIKNGLKFTKVRVPLGTIGVIYEARPNVTVDVAALCLKSGNCVVLRGGKEAINSNRALYEIISNAIESAGFNKDVVGFIDGTSRELSAELLKQGDCIDVVIPRGGDGLKHFVLENATMPVIASAGGVCHTYIHESANLDMAEKIIYNAKMQRPSVCNALEQLIIDRSIAAHLPSLLVRMVKDGCTINGSEEVCKLVPGAELCEATEYKKEHLDLTLTVSIVDNYIEAINQINNNNTKHSDAIIAQDQKVIEIFKKKVDTGCLYVNASTRFTDGFEFGFGAEIGISTQKLHARGPLALKQLTSEKYIIVGNGQVRS
ncbi:MAG: glutamate-5-semialdehyde dehydrogenase [Clostridiales bacterium]|nr:glutamate-5-semialdehyde dehydrogenase [Clostridiales bacterium]